MSTFFDISFDHINLFSIMIGISVVSLSSLYNGRIRWTRIAFTYFAFLAFYYGYIKDFHNPSDLSRNRPTIHQYSPSTSNDYKESTVDTASAYSGKNKTTKGNTQ